MENQEALKTGTLIGELSDSVQNQIDYLFADGVVPSRVVVGGIFFAGNQLFRVKKLTVSSSTDFIYK